MNFNLDKKYIEVQNDAHDFARTIAPYATIADEMSTVHPEVLASLRSSNLCDLMVPKEYGGRFDHVDPLAICIVREILMAVSSHADSLFALQGIGSFAITTSGSLEQKDLWLPRIATADVLPALALTEPDVGSDLKNITTTISPCDDGNIAVNGEKSWISNAPSASFFVVFARDGAGYSMVLVPSQAKGITVTQTPEIIAPHVLGDVTFSNVTLPKSAILGQPGNGLDLVLSTLAVFRVSVAGAAVGLAQAALEEATRHTRTRIQFGKPLAKLGPVALMLADSWTDIEMARLLTYRAAASAVDDPAAALNLSSMAKLASSEAASRVVDRCVQVMGRFGLIRNSKIERLYRQARPMRIYEGASDILRLGIARQLTKEVQ